MKAGNILMIVGGSLLVVGTILFLIPKKEEKKSGVTGSDETTKKEDNTPPPSDFSNYQKWVYSIENGQDYCRWYDRTGKNTRTYNQPCSKSQAGMYSNKNESTN